MYLLLLMRALWTLLPNSVMQSVAAGSSNSNKTTTRAAVASNIFYISRKHVAAAWEGLVHETNQCLNVNVYTCSHSAVKECE